METSIGQTKRPLKFRLKEQERYIKNLDCKRSIIAQHFSQFKKLCNTWYFLDKQMEF